MIIFSARSTFTNPEKENEMRKFFEAFSVIQKEELRAEFLGKESLERIIGVLKEAWDLFRSGELYLEDVNMDARSMAALVTKTERLFSHSPDAKSINFSKFDMDEYGFYTFCQLFLHDLMSGCFSKSE